MACVPGFPGAPVMEPKEPWVDPERLEPREHLVRKERKEQRENLGSMQGPAGQKGQRGNKGDIGTPGLSSQMNWKECTWKKEVIRGSGEIFVSGLSIIS